MAPEYMTVGLDERPRRHRARRAGARAGASGRRDRGRAGAGHGPGNRRASCTGCSIAPACRWCSTPTRSTPLSESPTSWWGRKGATSSSRRIPGELARLMGVTSADVQANRVELAQNFAESHQLYVVLKGHRSLDRHARRPRLRQPHGQSRHGDRRHGRRAHRHDRGLAGASCSTPKRPAGWPCTCTAWPAIWPRRPKAKSRLMPSDLVAHIGDAILELTARKRVEKP